jgi:hypothetical protein
MSKHPQSPREPWEDDPVWKLLDAAPATKAGPRFADDVVRLARLDVSPAPWWRRIFAPAPMAGLAVATAALAFGIFALTGPADEAPATPSVATQTEDIEWIEEQVEAEILIAVVDHLDEFSDAELVSLIGF